MGNGQAITVAASSVNLKNVSAQGWKKDEVYHVPLLIKNFTSDGTVFGTLDLKCKGNNQVEILRNKYDFDIGADKGHLWNGEFFRNISTWLGEQVATGFGLAPGNGTPYWINFSGNATLGKGPK